MDIEIPQAAARSFSFGAFLLVPERQALTRDGQAVRLGGRAFDMLTVLVNRPGELLTKRELMALVWPDTVVAEGSLKVHMAAVRRALGDVPSPASYIATVSGRGYQFIAAVETGHLAPLARAALDTPSPRHNLPVRSTSIVGRTETIDLVSQDLKVSRLLSLVGANGVGKSTVAVAVAELAVRRFGDGVWHVDLAGARSLQDLTGSVASVLGMSPGDTDESTSLSHLLRGRQVLLVLDNCDHAVDAAAEWADRLLTCTTGVSLLVTSREPLQVAGERVRRLQGLEVPPGAARLNARQALGYPAVQLFVERAAACDEGFVLGDAEAQAITEVCRRLDGLALAIELAATHLAESGASGLMQELAHGCHRLGCRRAGPLRHRSMEALLDWACQGLPDDEADVLLAMSVTHGDFDGGEVCALTHLPAAQAAEAVRRLIQKSLIVADPGAGRVVYRMAETTRGYCRDRLRHGGHEPLLLERREQYTRRAAGDSRRPAVANIEAGRRPRPCPVS